MNYNFNNKVIRIPDKDIERIAAGLDISNEEAIQIWLEDEGYIKNEEQEALCKKAKDNKITATIHEAKSTVEKKERTPRAVAANPTKEKVIAAVAHLLETLDEVKGVSIENAAKLITFNIGDDEFKIDLIQKRKKK